MTLAWTRDQAKAAECREKIKELQAELARVTRPVSMGEIIRATKER